MAFKNWTRWFRGAETNSDRLGDAAEADDALATSATRHETATDEAGNSLARKALIKELEQGFHQVGRVVEQLDRHLSSTNHLLESVASGQERLPALMGELTAAASASRHAHEVLAAELGRRDEANQALLKTLDSYAEHLELERDHHRSQLALVMRLQRGGRRLLLFMLFLCLLGMSLLLALVLVLALRPDLIGQQPLPALLPPAQSQSLPEPDPGLTSAEIRAPRRPADTTPLDSTETHAEDERTVHQPARSLLGDSLEDARQSDNDLIRNLVEVIQQELASSPQESSPE